MTLDEYLTEFRKGLWNVDSIDDVVKYAARMVASHGGGMQYDGLGLIDEKSSTYPRIPDVKFNEIYSECEEEII